MIKFIFIFIVTYCGEQEKPRQSQQQIFANWQGTADQLPKNIQLTDLP